MSTSQYLLRHAEPEAALCARLPRRYRHVVCIPAFAEAEAFLESTMAAVDRPDVLAILVVNASAAASTEQLQVTQAIAAHLKQTCRVIVQLAGNITLMDGAGGVDILLVERCTPQLFLGEKEGVGMARKIACDIACRLITDGYIASPWIHTTDADCTLPADYFRAAGNLDAGHTSALLYPFIHAAHSDEAVREAQQLYDWSLDYYVAGLAWAGSPWAFHTLGSTLAISAVHYAKVRGFPARRAGEDFYLLNKLGKTGAIRQLDTTPLRLETRVSDRVPFGTGPALKKILAMENPGKEFVCYHPRCFVILKCWLELKSGLWQEGTVLPDAGFIAGFCRGRPEYALVDAAILADCLAGLGVNRALEHARSHSRSEQVYLAHLDNWFDAFMTLKFIHWLRNRHYPSVTLKAIREDTGLPFAVFAGHVPTLPASNLPPQSLHPGTQAR